MLKKRLPLFFLMVISGTRVASQAPAIIPSNWITLKGLWEFNNPGYLTQATFGIDLLLVGTHTAIPGPGPGDHAVNIGIGSHYKCFHNIPANGGGSLVNEYSLVIDFRVPAISPWYCFYQTHLTNGNDGELFVSPSGTVGRATNGPGYSAYTVIPGEWYRLVVTADLGSQYKIYLDGILVKVGGALALDGDYALSPAAANNFFSFFADNDGEDAPVDVALCAVFQGVLTADEVTSLGGYGHTINPVLTGILPYLQTPTPTSMYLSWHSDSTSSTLVHWGTSSALGMTTSGTYENIGGKLWHTVHLTGLATNTEYHYKCISGSEESPGFIFRTPFEPGTAAGHLRFLIFGDNQSDIAKSSYIASQANLKMKEMFGNDIQNQIQLVVNHGDIVGNGANAVSFDEEYFKPFSPLSCRIPCMVSIGNHEVESNYYYQYMKYEDLTGAVPPIAERYYAFTLANTRFIALNTNGAFQNTTQENWFVAQLVQAEADTGIDFVFVYAHHPVMSEVWPAGNTTWVRQHVVAHMAGYPKSAFYTSGHTHAYEHAVWESNTDAGDFRMLIGGGAGGYLDRWGAFSNQTDYPETFKSLDHYGFQLIDIDVSARSYTGYCFSLGHPDVPLGCQLVDVFHRDLNTPPPVNPSTIGPSGGVIGPVVLTAGPFSGTDTQMSSHFQLTSIPGDYSSPLFESKRNLENWYGDSGPPDYNPVNLNAGIDLHSVPVDTPMTLGQTYGWRVRYRDQNLRWSAWSDEALFTPAQGFSISGMVSYDNIQMSPLGQVTVSLMMNDSIVGQTLTDNTGYYTFPSSGLGQYRIVCTSTHPWGGANATDALLILSHFVGINPLNGLRLLAGNVDGINLVNAVDALATSKRFTGLINSFAAGDWIFESPVFNISTSPVVVNIKGICTADVNGSFIP